MRNKAKKVESWGDFKERLRGAWRLYKHDYIPDPEIAKLEERFLETDQKTRDRRVAKMFKKGEAMLSQGRDSAQAAAETVAEEIREKRPAAEVFVRNRVEVLRKALSEFSEGYYESANGKRNFWGELPYNEDLVRKDNPPVIYEAVKRSN